MGLAASQARLLTLTARIHDVEYQAQMIQSAKLDLAIKEDEVYRRYTEALDAQSLTFKTDNGNTVMASFNNLCGLASINNGMNRNYIFRTNTGNLKDDMLILPDDVYNSYQEYGGNDPYAYAMKMIGADVDEEEFENKVNTYAKDLMETEQGQNLKSIYEQMKTLFEEKIYTKVQDSDDIFTNDKNDMFLNICKEPEKYFKDGVVPEGIREELEKLSELQQKYQYNIFKVGVESIYSELSGENKSDYAKHENKFNYYLHWGQLIEEEGGIDFCTNMSSYGEGKDNDAEFLTQMVESGRITIDQVTFKNGMVSDEITSASSDSHLAMTTTSQVDSKELKKAEAEYEHAMKQLNRKDKQYDTDLNKLETERTALTTEYDAVKKVISDNIERTFGIFS